MFGPYRQTYRRLCDVLICQFLICQLGVGRCRRVDHQRLHIGYISQKREDLKIVYEFESRFLSALDLECENACATVREVALIQLVVRMIRNRRVIDLIDFRVVSNLFYSPGSILCMPLEPQRQCLCSLQQQESRERRNACALIAQKNSSYISNECRRSYSVCK